MAYLRLLEIQAFQGDYAAARDTGLHAFPGETWAAPKGKADFYATFMNLKSLNGDPLIRAICLSMSGRKDVAFRALNSSLESDPLDTPVWIHRPEFASLHDDPRFADLLKRMNLQAR